MLDDLSDSVSSFVSVCEVLGIDGEALREQVRERGASGKSSRRGDEVCSTSSDAAPP